MFNDNWNNFFKNWKKKNREKVLPLGGVRNPSLYFINLEVYGVSALPTELAGQIYIWNAIASLCIYFLNGPVVL